MAVRVVRLGSPRAPEEGLRLGTVRHPPRGVPKDRHAALNFYDVWVPELAPSADLLKRGQTAGSARDWSTFVKRYRLEMAAPEKVHLLRLLAALSATTHFSVGCYCADESHCHRSVLRALLADHGAVLA
jgi:uncharacterized protein YeaO (DUF488 family)